jgi:hypothetical protein
VRRRRRLPQTRARCCWGQQPLQQQRRQRAGQRSQQHTRARSWVQGQGRRQVRWTRWQRRHCLCSCLQAQHQQQQQQQQGRQRCT